MEYMIRDVCDKLSAMDLIAFTNTLARTNHQLHRLIKDEGFWTHQLQRLYPSITLERLHSEGQVTSINDNRGREIKLNSARTLFWACTRMEYKRFTGTDRNHRVLKMLVLYPDIDLGMFRGVNCPDKIQNIPLFIHNVTNRDTIIYNRMFKQFTKPPPDTCETDFMSMIHDRMHKYTWSTWWRRNPKPKPS